MEIYSLNYNYIKNFLNDAVSYFNSNIEQSALVFAIAIMLISILILNRKILKLEKTQFNEIDDITSFNRLIDEELGTLKKEQNTESEAELILALHSNSKAA